MSHRIQAFKSSMMAPRFAPTRGSLLVALALGACTELAVTPAFGQAVEAPTPAPAASTPPTTTPAQEGTQTVTVVSARKHNEMAQAVPITMDVLGGQQIKDSGIVRVEDLQANVPGLVIDSYESQGQIALRGVGAGDVGLGTDQSVAIHVDGVYQVFGSAGLGRMFDVERVEVLKGPQGTLYGRNATAGVVNLISRKPQDKFAAEGDLSYGSFNTVKEEGMVNVPLGAETAARFAFSGATSDGRLTNVRDGSKVGTADNYDAFRASLRSSIAQTQLDLSVQYIDDWSNLGSAYIRDPHNPALRSGSTESSSFTRVDFEHPIKQSKKDLAVSLRLAHQFGDVDVTSITGYGSHEGGFESDLTSLDPTSGPWSTTEPYRQVSEEIQANFSTGNTDWTVGAFYLDYRGQDNRDVDLPTFDYFDVQTRARSTGKSYAAFGQADYKFSDKLRLEAGIRYTEETKTASSFATEGAGGEGSFTVDPAVSGSRTWRNVSGRLGADYFLTKATMLYGSIATGFKSGGVIPNALAADLAPGPISYYKPEKLLAYEIGQKTTLPGGLGIANLSAFYYDYTDKVEFVLNQALISDFYNAGKARVYGLDGTLDLRLAQHLSWDEDVELLSAKYTSFLSGDGSSYAGNTLGRAPKVSVTSGLTFDRIPVGDVGTFSLRGEYVYRDKMFFDFANALSQSAIGLLNLSAHLDGAGGKWSVYAAGRNLANKHYIEFYNASGTRALPASERTLQIGVHFKI